MILGSNSWTQILHEIQCNTWPSLGHQISLLMLFCLAALLNVAAHKIALMIYYVVAGLDRTVLMRFHFSAAASIKVCG